MGDHVGHRAQAVGEVNENAERDTGQLPIELILLRQVTSYLDTPTFLVGATGDLLFFNEAAEPLLGLRFDDVGELSMDEWLHAFRPSDQAGHPIPHEAVNLVVALRDGRVVQDSLFITGADGERRAIATTAFPLRRPSGELLCAVALFWPLS